MTPHSPPPSGPAWSSAQWLSLLMVGAIAAAGWVQSWRWQKLFHASTERATAAPGERSMAANPTLSLMQDVDMIRQNELLSEENNRLSMELKQLQEQADKDRERAALDGSGGILR